MFNAFEHSFRGISKEFDDKIYPLNPNLGVYFLISLSKLNLLNAEMNTFIEIVLVIRNSIHNNGIFVATKGNPAKSLPWKNKTYNFYNGTIINVDDVWPSKPKKLKNLSNLFGYFSLVTGDFSANKYRDQTFCSCLLFCSTITFFIHFILEPS